MVPRKGGAGPVYQCVTIAEFGRILDFLRGAYPSESPLARFGHTLLFRAGGANLGLGVEIKAS